jgi:hypothetical protein
VRYKAIELYIPKAYPVKDSQLYHSEIADIVILTKPHNPRKVYSDDAKNVYYYPVPGTDLYRARIPQKFTTDQKSRSFWFTKIVPETDPMFNIDVFFKSFDEIEDTISRERLVWLSWYPLKHFIQDALDLPE